MAERKRVAVVGSGGAGINAAWLLERDHDVTLFERETILGGHASTTVVEHEGAQIPCDEAFAWFSDVMYPRLSRLLAIHDIPTRVVRMGVTFTNRHRNFSISMPPTTVLEALRLVGRPRQASYLLSFAAAVRSAVPLVEARDPEPVLGDFLDGLSVDRRALAEFVEPFFVGFWGGPPELMREFSAYPVLKYLVLHRPGMQKKRWRQFENGAASYVETVAASLRKATIHRGARVTAIGRDTRGWCVCDDKVGRSHFDEVVVATGASDAARLLAGTSHLDEVQRTLNRFRYYPIRVATHGDASVMPERRSDWSTVHVDDLGDRIRLTAWVGQQAGAPLFVSYVGDREPERVENLRTFNVPMLSPEHYRAQRELHELQGQDGLWFAGDWTRDVGSHEDALESAIFVAQRLAPDSERLVALLAGS